MNRAVKNLMAKRRIRVIARAVTCTLMLALASCQIPQIRQAEQGAGLPGGYNAATGWENSTPLAAVIGIPAVSSMTRGPTRPETSAQLGIDEFYTDPILQDLLHQALANNRELLALNEEVQIARNEVLARSGAYLPFAFLRGSAGLERASQFTPEGAAERDLEFLPGKHFPDPMGNFMFGLNFFWQLDIWRELRNARDAAKQRYVAAAERRNFFVTRLVAEVAENYYSLLALDNRLLNLNTVISFQEQSLVTAELLYAAGRANILGVQRFQAEVRRNQSERTIIAQEIIETENRINFRINRLPQPVERASADFFDLNIHALDLGLPAQLLLNRPDIRQAERELQAAGLDVKVARARFFPRLDIMGGIGYQAFNPRYLFYTPESMAANLAGELVAPIANRRAIQADYRSANARQLESIYNYQRIILNAYTEVINRMSMVENYRRSIEIKKLQLSSLVTAVETASKLFQNARAEYLDVLFSQRDLLDARMVLIETKRQQLAAIVNTYQALGGGDPWLMSNHAPPPEPVGTGIGGRSKWMNYCRKIIGFSYLP
jgi:outer membrane protein TolC